MSCNCNCGGCSGAKSGTPGARHCGRPGQCGARGRQTRVGKLILAGVIRVWRLRRSRPACPRAGLSCSGRGLAAARAGLGVAGVLAAIEGCVCDQKVPRPPLPRGKPQW